MASKSVKLGEKAQRCQKWERNEKKCSIYGARSVALAARSISVRERAAGVRATSALFAVGFLHSTC